ncbi:hypothetical protein [Xanthomonas graminis]|nr:hypothetical protein [Xanthomonas translucens]
MSEGNHAVCASRGAMQRVIGGALRTKKARAIQRARAIFISPLDQGSEL